MARPMPLTGTNMPSTPGMSATSCIDIAAITVTERLPEFWTDSPRLWFAQFEAIIAPQKQGDEYKYNTVISKLPKEVVHQVSDILTNPPPENKYSVIKDRLIDCYEESEQRRFHKLLAEMNLGDQKPSQLLRKMREAGCGKINEDTIRILFMSQLTPSVTTVLAVTEQLTLDKLSEMADRIHENMRFNTTMQSTGTADVNTVTHLSSQLATLQLEVAALRENRSRHINRRSNFRSRSNSRRRSANRQSNNYCYYHRRFKENAYKCDLPGSWNHKRQPSEN
ncbi:uncharacterized protein LOC131842462 [Achroia grisella]|uniref:uncharacterized protein LOC131842462 n=1 Tax=Achroia grisella TaxID=688607 RepID=UPI0027D26382|nr:uncharacterized protein LOC131842462 [Achroia grisella]